MTAKEIFELRKLGRMEEAYEAARCLYATDKGPYASTAMFWTAADILRARVNACRTEEAQKILLALQRLLPSVPDKEGWVSDTYRRCEQLLLKANGGKDASNGIAEHTRTGLWGEEVAADYLRDKGYDILERDWHSGHRDIDIIAQHDDTIVFVEVKQHKRRSFAQRRLRSICRHKKQLLLTACKAWLRKNKWRTGYRFDVVEIYGDPETKERVEVDHIERVQLFEDGRRFVNWVA